MRIFFALDLGAEARLAAAEVVRALQARPGGESVRWVRPETLHVTLCFLGETPAAEIGPLVRAVAVQVASLPAFTLALGGVQAFPSPRRPRVVALHLEPTAPVAALAAAVEAGVAMAGPTRAQGRRAGEPPAEPRPFRAHLTLGRVTDRRAPSLEALAPPPASPFDVREIVLFESRTSPGGSVYTPLERIALGCGAAPGAAPVHTIHPHSGEPEETPHGDDEHHSR